ncbi:putative DNA-directed RNA polymerase beta subunit [Salmonella phage pSal-SNUABM-04]|nr:putative DNA-directed RNA polymerase beta subunit [Salmonella phage pSal-SNUABM-04]
MDARQVHVRDLRNLNSDQVWRLRGRYDVTFDDGVTQPMSGRHIKLSWPYWGISRFYPQVPTPSTMCYRRGGEWATDDRHIDLMSEAAVLARKAGIDLADTRYLLSQHIYADAFNLTVKNLLSYCTTIDIDTMMQIYDHPDYQIIHEWAKQYPSGYDEEGVDKVNEAYEIIERIIRSPELADNPVAMSVLDKTIKMDQVLQAYVRGKTSEIDSRVYSNQVWEGFFGGLNSVISRLKESGATSRSHLYNTDKIAEAEYGSRKLQLAANVLTHFTLDDCGTEHAHEHTFRDTKESQTQYDAMVGMRFRFNGETGPWRVFEKGHFEDVVDKPLLFRSAMTCRHMAKQGICAVCMGDLVYNLSEKTSPGHLASTSISEKGTQGILSTKHLDFLRELFTLVIGGRIKGYFRGYEKGSEKGLRLLDKPEFGTWSEYSLVVSEKMHSELSQVAYYDNLEDIDETSLPDVTDVTFVRLNADGEPCGGESLDVRMGVCGNFSKAFLSYFLKVRDEIQFIRKGEIRIPMSGWKPKAPFLIYTNRSESMAEFVAGLETKLRSVAADKNETPMDFTTDATVKMSKDGKVKTLTLVEMGGSTERQCTFAMFDTFRYINRKLKGIPMTHIGIMLAISRVESPINPFPAVGFDKETAIDGMGKRFLDHNTLIAIRSAAPMLFFQGQQDNLNRVGFYTTRKIPASLYDGSFKTRLH